MNPTEGVTDMHKYRYDGGLVSVRATQECCHYQFIQLIGIKALDVLGGSNPTPLTAGRLPPRTEIRN